MAGPDGSAMAAPAGPPAPGCLLVGRCQCDLRRNGHAHSEAPDAPRGSEVTMVAVRANGVHLASGCRSAVPPGDGPALDAPDHHVVESPG